MVAFRESLNPAYGIQPTTPAVIGILSLFFLGRERLIATQHSGMPGWSEKLFALMFRTAEGVTPYFNLPPNRVVEMGTQVEL